MATATQIELTPHQKLKVEAGRIVNIPATWEEFMEFLETSPYKTEFIYDEITIMGVANIFHEWLVSHLIWILKNIYQNQPSTLVLGSNIGVAHAKNSFFNPDITVLKEKPIFYKDSKSIIENPYMVIEILSAGTAHYDYEMKLFEYQSMPSIQEIVLVNPKDKALNVFSRTADIKVWTMTLYSEPTDTVLIDGNTIQLAHFFEGMPN